MTSHESDSGNHPWRKLVTEYIVRHPDRPHKTRSLARELDIPDEDYHAFRQLVREMLDSGEVLLGRGRALRAPNADGTIIGTFRANRRGFGFVQVSNRPDLYVSRENTAGAIDGDTVAIRVIKAQAGDALGRAEVVRIVKRSAQRLVGVLERTGRQWLVRPQGRNAPPAVMIDDPGAKSARAGDVVVVESLSPGRREDAPHGVIIERLGAPDDVAVQAKAIIRRFDIPDEFPIDVRSLAIELANEFDPDDVTGRRDLRDLRTITIDPVDARDFDDAISIENLAHGVVRLGVHIADVAHFVTPGSPLDREAYERGNSVYLPRFVVPMLPESLSNGVCSLQPGESRYTRSAFIEYDRDGRVIGTDFATSVIRSAARLTYEEASGILEGAPAAGAFAEVHDLLRDAERLARRIRQRRLKNGMIVLALPEVAMKFDERGRIIDAGPADTSFSHTLIEMFMVEANEAVSRFLSLRGIPHLRRVHEAPDDEDSGTLRMLGPVLGRKVTSSLKRGDILKLIDEVAGRPEERITHTLLLRSMSQARYSPADEGHFALASDDYCHFTSPIRRYPDLIVHRLLDRELRKSEEEIEDEEAETYFATLHEEQLVRMGAHTSQTERRAQQAERELRHILLLELMEKKLGSAVDVVITGVARFGVFVQVQKYFADGVIRVGDFGPDQWDFDDRTMTWRGRETRHVVAVGQALRAIVASVDHLQQELTLVPESGRPMGKVAKGEFPSASKPPKKRSRPGERDGAPTRGRRRRGR